MTDEQIVLAWVNKMGLGGLSEDHCTTLENFCAFARAALTPARQIVADSAQAESRGTWSTDGGYKCLNCGKGLSQHAAQRYCPAATAPSASQKG